MPYTSHCATGSFATHHLGSVGQRFVAHEVVLVEFLCYLFAYFDKIARLFDIFCFGIALKDCLLSIARSFSTFCRDIPNIEFHGEIIQIYRVELRIDALLIVRKLTRSVENAAQFFLNKQQCRQNVIIVLYRYNLVDMPVGLRPSRQRYSPSARPGASKLRFFASQQKSSFAPIFCLLAVDIYEADFADKIDESRIHYPLKRQWCVFQSKRHFNEIVVLEVSRKSCFGDFIRSIGELFLFANERETRLSSAQLSP